MFYRPSNLPKKSLRPRTSSNWSGCKPSSFSRRCKALGEQVKDLDETISKAAMNSKKTPKTGGLSS